MHKFLRAIGFSNIEKKEFNEQIAALIERPDMMRVTRDSEGNEFAELSKLYGSDMGITVRGSFGEEDVFHMDYYFPFANATDVSTQEAIDIEKHAEKESYAGVCDEMRLGVTLIFYLQNVADYLSEHRGKKHVSLLNGAQLSALSVDGKVLLPIQEKVTEKQTANSNEKRSHLLAEARAGNEEAIEHLTIQDMDTYSKLSKRIMKEDILSIVTSCFMPYGIESDQYAILGEILDVEKIKNKVSGEEVYSMKIECNEMIFQLTINKNDLLGEPAVGRRFKGTIWMQGTVNLS